VATETGIGTWLSCGSQLLLAFSPVGFDYIIHALDSFITGKQKTHLFSEPRKGCIWGNERFVLTVYNGV
jgi:hypothetical protein